MFYKFTSYAGDGSSPKYVNTDNIIYVDSYKDPDGEDITVLHLSNGEELEVRESIDSMVQVLGFTDAVKMGGIGMDMANLIKGVLAKHEK